jgi:hypothetical protein
MSQSDRFVSRKLRLVSRVLLLLSLSLKLGKQGGRSRIEEKIQKEGRKKRKENRGISFLT